MCEPVAYHGSSTTALDLRSQVEPLQVERALALDAGLGQNAAYMTDLEEELAYRVQLFEVAAVTEIATLRGELGGLQVG